MPCGEDEAVTAKTMRICGVKPENFLVKQVGHRGKADGRARVTMTSFFNGICSENTSDVYCFAIELVEH
jgi:hypothetical protein